MTGQSDPIDAAKCDGCGKLTPIDQLDAKPQPGHAPETADWTVLECRSCYGPGWLPAI